VPERAAESVLLTGFIRVMEQHALVDHGARKAHAKG
jgi:hypothetical protein